MGQRHRRIRALVITGGGERQETLQQLFDSENWEVEFSPAVSSRSIRSRQGCLEAVYKVGLIPEAEYEALSSPDGRESFWDALETVPLPDGSTEHYAAEFWSKSKTINRGRSVLGCLLAHLMAMKRFVDSDFDVILEDNVRWNREAVERILDLQNETPTQHGDMLYYGWLGSEPNLKWVYSHYIPEFENLKTVPFPRTQDIERTVGLKGNREAPGGTPIWGLYAYWISRAGYEAVLSQLQNDIGSLFWKSKRMRYYQTKPADKIVPRALMAHNLSVNIVCKPVFYRAPMLKSNIHPQWDSGFCQSTSLQLQQTDSDWTDLRLTSRENTIVAHFKMKGEWIRLEGEPDKVPDG